MLSKLKKYAPWLCFAVAAFLWILFYLTHIERLLDSDMSSEMVLSRILAKEHRIITPSWKYSTELRVLNNQLVFTLFLALTHSWKASRLLSGVTLLILYGGSYYYFCTQAGLKKYFPHTAALLFLPFSAEYTHVVLYGLYYIPHIAISFTTIGLTLQLGREASGRGKWISAGLLLLLSVAAGMGGPRQVFILYLPLLLVALLELYRRRGFVLTGAYLAFLGGALGYGINRWVLQKNYHFNGWTDIRFTGFSFARLEGLLMGFLHVYGYEEDLLYSAAIVKNGACFVIIGALLLYLWRYLRPRRGAAGTERTREERLVVDFFLMMLLVCFLLYLFTDMFYQDRYLLPYIVFGAPLLGYALLGAGKSAVAIADASAVDGAVSGTEAVGGAVSDVEAVGGAVSDVEAVGAEAVDSAVSGADASNGSGASRSRLWDYVLPAAAIAALVAAGLGRYPGLLRTDVTSALREVSDALVAQGYESGYASFWNGNVMTELSEGQLDMYNWDDYVSEKIDVNELYVWLQAMRHTTEKPAGKVFILLGTQEETECPLVRYLTEADVAYRNASYVAYGFGSYEEMLQCLSYYRYNLWDVGWLYNGESVEGAWILHQDATTQGPNMTLYAGSYTFTVNGGDIDALEMVATSEFGAVELPATLDAQTARGAIWEITVPVNTYHVELHLINRTEGDVRIESAIVQRQ